MDRKQAKVDACRAFAIRLDSAADAARLPSHRNGRQSTIAEAMGVSAEAARRWFAGESIPRQEMLVRLAKYLHVDPAWLQMGSQNRPTAPEQRRRAGELSGAANLAAGLMQIEGAAVSFDPVPPGADFVAISRGRQYAVHVSPVVDGVIQVPAQYEHLLLLGFVRDRGQMAFFELDHDLVLANAVPKDGGLALSVEVSDEIVVAGHSMQPLNFAGMLGGRPSRH